jgi:energy-coupling factor transporter ATP-binding protein EcfA2
LIQPPGAVYGLHGLNGNGKTTTIECLLGLLWPNGGRIAAAGEVSVLLEGGARLSVRVDDVSRARLVLASSVPDDALRDAGNGPGVDPAEVNRLFDRSYLADVARLARGYSDVLVEEYSFRLYALVPLHWILALLAPAPAVALRRRF